MAKNALKRGNQANLFSLPDSIGGAGGAIKLNNFEDRGAPGGGKGAGKKKKGGCC